MTIDEAISHAEDVAKENEKVADTGTLEDGYTLDELPCNDCISRQYLIDKAVSWDKHYADSERYVSLLDIQNAPPVNPQEPKTGHWITTRTFEHDGEFYCDKCKCDAPQNIRWDYCPNCGARMSNGRPKKPSLWWKCERCGKLIPYMADFCHECADELLGEAPKPFEPQESEEAE